MRSAGLSQQVGVPSPRVTPEAWGRTLRATLLRHPPLPAISISQPVIGPGILRGVEALLGALRGAANPAALGVHAIYAVLIYTIGFVDWEIPRTRRQSDEDYAAASRQATAGLQAADFPIAMSVIDELGAVASEEQLTLGLAVLSASLATAGFPTVAG